MTSRLKFLVAAAWAGACLSQVAAAQALPSPGRYEGQFCVAAASGASDCGPARIELHRGGRARVFISDILYLLTLHSSQADVVLKHGAMQIDEFTAPYEWMSRTLQFVDPAKGTRYEVKFLRRVSGIR